MPLEFNIAIPHFGNGKNVDVDRSSGCRCRSGLSRWSFPEAGIRGRSLNGVPIRGRDPSQIGTTVDECLVHMA